MSDPFKLEFISIAEDSSANFLQLLPQGEREISPQYRQPIRTSPAHGTDPRLATTDAVLPNRRLVAVWSRGVPPSRISGVYIYSAHEIDRLDPIELRAAWTLSFLKNFDPNLRRQLQSSARRRSYLPPNLMGILNLSRDSFSITESEFASDWRARFVELETAGAQVLDLGIESTSPGRAAVGLNERRERLVEVLSWISERRKAGLSFAWVSVECAGVEGIFDLLQSGPVEIINDIKGSMNPSSRKQLEEWKGLWVLMHQLELPVNPANTLPCETDVVDFLRHWFDNEVSGLNERELSRIVFDPGLSFGKSFHQCFEIVRRFSELSDLGGQNLVGISRKSFLRALNDIRAASRDEESVGLAMAMVSSRIDFLRVHAVELHQRIQFAYLAGQRLESNL